MTARRVEACCVLTADGKLRATAAAMPAAVRAWLRGVRERCDVTIRPASAGRAALTSSLDAAKGRRVLVQGGPDVLRGLAAAGLLTHLHAAILPVVAGGARVPTLLGPAASSLLRHSVELRLARFRVADGAALVTYAVRPPEESASARSRPRLQLRP